MKILVADKISPKGVELLRQQPGFEVIEAYNSTPEKVLSLVKDVHAIAVRSETQITAEVLAAAPLLADAGREPLVDRAVFAAQMGLAAWRLAQDPSLAPVARVAARMLGAADRLASRQSHAGLLKLYALKELLAA